MAGKAGIEHPINTADRFVMEYFLPQPTIPSHVDYKIAA
jgi:hypothetical protein